MWLLVLPKQPNAGRTKVDVRFKLDGKLVRLGSETQNEGFSRGEK